jgi:tetratricopeptide (TPR) repeat protein
MMFLFFGILIVVIGIVMMMLNGLSLDPFFLPLDVFLLVTLYLLIIVTGLNFFFRNLEIRHNTRNSQKFLMARNSQRTGIAIIIICVFVAVLVVAPFTTNSANKILSLEGRDSISTPGETTVKYFENQDRLGLFKSEWVEVQLTVGNVVFEICEKEDFEDNSFCDDPMANRQLSVAAPSARFGVPEEGYVQLALVVTNELSGLSSFDFRVERNPAPIFVGLQPLIICVVFIVMNAIWAMYLRPIKGEYSTSSVYSDDYIVPTIAESAPRAEMTTEAKEAFFEPARPTIKRAKTAPPPPVPEADALPPPPLPGRAHPLPKGAFLDELMLALSSEGDGKEVVGFLKALIELDPVSKDALFHLGEVYEQDGNYQFAYNEYNRITRIDPKDDKAWVKRGEVLMPLKKELDAVDSFRHALELNTENPAAAEWLRSIKRENQKLMARAIDRSTNRDFRGAIELYDRILARDPDNVQALLGKGTMYRRLEKWPASLEALNKVLELEPENIAAVRNKVEVFENVMSWDEALECYDEIIDRSPENYLDWVRRGDVLFELGRSDDAVESYRKAEELNPDSERVKKRIRLLVAPEMDETVKEFTKLPGIGKSKAIALFEAGFESIEDLEKTGVKKLSKVKGISKGLAKKLKQHLKG